MLGLRITGKDGPMHRSLRPSAASRCAPWFCSSGGGHSLAWAAWGVSGDSWRKGCWWLILFLTALFRCNLHTIRFHPLKMSIYSCNHHHNPNRDFPSLQKDSLCPSAGLIWKDEYGWAGLLGGRRVPARRRQRAGRRVARAGASCAPSLTRVFILRSSHLSFPTCDV